MNVELLRKVQKHILEEPLRVDMQDWRADDDEGMLNLGRIPATIPACGTVACIAGWADLLANGKLDDIYISTRASDALLIDHDQSELLFFDDEWPADLQEDINRLTPGTKEYAACVSRRIDRIIESGGHE